MHASFNGKYPNHLFSGHTHCHIGADLTLATIDHSVPTDPALWKVGLAGMDPTARRQVDTLIANAEADAMCEGVTGYDAPEQEVRAT